MAFGTYRFFSNWRARITLMRLSLRALLFESVSIV